MDQNFGKYEVLEKIGEGGFGIIYRASDPHIKRHVAIKTCTAEDDETRRRFVQEAQICGNLQHRNIVTVFDFGLEGSVPYLVQEYLSGEDLDRKIKRKDFLPFPEKLLYLIQVARGLQYAHAQGVIHRDIKPANIRILEDGTAKIMDFGIAKLANQQSGLTQTGMTLGTAAYLAPEQIRGDTLDGRTDIFSFGVLAYELLTYERPFQGHTLSTVLYQIINEQPAALSEHWADCPAELQRVISTCLAKRVADRYPSCSELLHDLNELRKRRRIDQEATLVPGTLTAPEVSPATTAPLPVQLPHAHTGPTASLGAPAPQPPAAPILGLDQLELTSTGDDDRTPHSISSTEALRYRSFSWAPWATLAALVLASVGAVWWYLQVTSPEVQAIPTTAAAMEPAAELEAPAEPTASAPTGTPAIDAGAGSEAPPVGGSEEQVPDAAPSEAPPPPPEEAPPPEPATLVVPAAFDAGARLTVSNRTYALDRRRELRVEPGIYRLVFELYRGDYQALEEVMVDVGPGESRTVDVPLKRPGLLSIQPYLASPMGNVFVNGTLKGPSPLRNLSVAPGTYRIRIQPLDAGRGQTVSTEVRISSQKHLIVTFNLGTGQAQINPGA